MTCSAVARLARLWVWPVALAACSPALNWRDVRLPEASLAVQFPCKPQAVSRQVPLAGQVVAMALSACEADGATFAISHAALGTPEGVTAALGALRVAAATHLGGEVQWRPMVAVPGMAPHPDGQRWRVRAQRPGGQGVVEQQVLLFTRGLRVYQATVIAERVSDDAADVFFASLRLGA